MDPLLAPFAELVARAKPSAPRRPFVSCTTGTWIRDDEATDPQYWVRHMREPVRFADAVSTLCAEDSRVLLEVGPGRTLCQLARLSAGDTPIVASTRHPQNEAEDTELLMQAAGELWTSGVSLDWSRVHGREQRRRVTLPTYPFERQRFWVERSDRVRAAGGDHRAARPRHVAVRSGVATRMAGRGSGRRRGLDRDVARPRGAERHGTGLDRPTANGTGHPRARGRRRAVRRARSMVTTR